MRYRVIITHQALQETQEAFEYYEEIRGGLGELFLQSVEDRYAALSKDPQLYSFCDSRNILRDVSVKGFPFLVIYEVIVESVVILAVHNTNKKPFEGH